MSSPGAALKDLTREEQLTARRAGRRVFPSGFPAVQGAACALLGMHRQLAQLRPWHALVSSICKAALAGTGGFPCAHCQTWLSQ